MAAKALLLVALVACAACLATAEPAADGRRKLRQFQQQQQVPQQQYQQQQYQQQQVPPQQQQQYPQGGYTGHNGYVPGGYTHNYYGQQQTYFFHPRPECPPGEYKTWRINGLEHCRKTIDLPTNINEYPPRDQQSIEHCPQEQIIHYLTNGEFGCVPQVEVYKGMCAAAAPKGD